LRFIRLAVFTYQLLQFSSTLLDIIHHPERNSTFILRADILSDKSAEEEPILASVSGYKATRQIRRRILPRSPKRDGPLEQDCIFFTPVTGDDLYHDLSSLVVLTPRLDDSETLPFYHPAVRQLAFRYLTTPEPILRIDIIPINPETNTSSDTNSRLHRTCLALLETVHRFGWGQHTGYKKRVLHDVGPIFTRGERTALITLAV
jgi:tRNASer (uridine44-2'-O)-methyltransferase